MKTKMVGLICFVLVVAVNEAPASEYHVAKDLLRSFEFSAPVFSSVISASDAEVGSIIYDLSSNQFKGRNNLGNWDAMTVPNGSLVTSIGTAEAVNRATITCASSPSTSSIVVQSGTWVTAVGNMSSGQCAITWTPFAGRPSCTLGTEDTGGYNCTWSSAPSATGGSVRCFDTTNNAPVGAETFDVICMGAR